MRQEQFMNVKVLMKLTKGIFGSQQHIKDQLFQDLLGVSHSNIRLIFTHLVLAQYAICLIASLIVLFQERESVTHAELLQHIW